MVFNKQLLLEFCKQQPFPGSKKYAADHPIWKCNIAMRLSPFEAWKNEDCLKLAIDNICDNVITEKWQTKYADFCKGFENAYGAVFASGNPSPQDKSCLAEWILRRFTIAKIAPKVTALAPSTMANILQEAFASDPNLEHLAKTNGVYCPMAGFGGIIEGAKRCGIKSIEAYDINLNFCNFYGWKQRDALAQTVITDKIVIACPPFGTTTERWDGTPDSMYYDFEEWCELLMQHIIAPNYIFIGPSGVEDQQRMKNGKKKIGLFGKKIGVKWWSEYTYERKNSFYI